MGIAAVLLTWAVALGLIVAIGLPWALVTSARAAPNAVVRSAMWWGLGVAVVVIEAVGLILPLRSGYAALIITGWAGASIVAAAVAIRVGWRLPHVRMPRMPGLSPMRQALARWSPAGVLLAVGGACVSMTLASAVLGPVTNYDSGLYHLGAIAYAGDLPTIPGLANLYFPLGYSTSTFPVAAFLGNGPWAGQGFRLLNGLIIVMALLDLVLRFRRRRVTSGSWVLLAGLAVAVPPLLWMPDYWVTSPTSDTGVLVLTIVGSAALADAVCGRRVWWSDAAVATVIAIVLVTMRPIMAVYAGAVVIVVITLAIRRRLARRGLLIAPVALFTLTTVVVQCLRDVRLSGWIQYPLSLVPVQVAWRAEDPVVNRTATLGAARDPNDLWNAAAGWMWISSWVKRLPTQWEFWIIVALLLGTLVVVLAARRSGAVLPWKRIAVASAPAALTVAVWFLASPPSFRFAWGPLFTLGAIPIGVGLSVIAQTDRQWWPRIPRALVALVGGCLAVLAVLSLVVRVSPQPRDGTVTLALGAVQLDLPAAMPPVAKTHLLTLDGGLTVHVPAQSDQCWVAYPLCTPQVSMSVIERGPNLADGFARAPTIR